MNNSLKNSIYRIIISTIIFAITLFFSLNEYLRITLLIASYLIIGYNVLISAFKNIVNGYIFDENFLMTLATFAAFVLGDYSEAIAIMLFFQIGEAFQSYAVNQSRKSISNLMNIRPSYANIMVNGKLEKMNPEKVKVGEIIIVKPGEKIPLDGIVKDGFSTIDTSALTGESIPTEVNVESKVISGSVNITGLLLIEVSKEFENSTVFKILDLVENATIRKANVENFITKFARYYTPSVVIIAVMLAIIPPIILNEPFSFWLYRAIIFLVISCPCALVISIPLSFFGGLGSASKNGILIKGSNYLEALANTKYVVFDKTGTITKGKFKVVKTKSFGVSKDELLKYSAYAEAYSNHPIAQSIKSEYKHKIDLNKIKNIQEFQGFGIKADVEDKEIYVGNAKLMEKINIDIGKINETGTIAYVVINKQYGGYLVILDEIKDDSFKVIKILNEMNIKKITMLTGDKKEIANDVAKKVCIDNVCSELLPINKVEKVEEIIKNKNSKDKLIFVGDGINDAPVLARSDIGIAMGGIGSDAAIEAADVVIMSDELTKIPVAIKISKKTLLIAKENIIFAIGIKLLVLILGAFGYVSIWTAVFADVGVSVIAILNSIRTLFLKFK